MNEEEFLEHAEWTKNNCIVSRALNGTEIRLQARLGKRHGKSEESITGRAAIVKNLRTWQPE